MDFDSIVVVGILGAAAVNALVLASVLWMTRPGRYRVVEVGDWGVRTAPEPYGEAGQPDPAKMAV